MPTKVQLIDALSEMSEMYEIASTELRTINAAVLDNATRMATITTDHNANYIEDIEISCKPFTVNDIPNKSTAELVAASMSSAEGIYQSIVGLREEVDADKKHDNLAMEALARVEELKRKALSRRSNTKRSNGNLLATETANKTEPYTPPASVRSNSPLPQSQVVEAKVVAQPTPKAVAKDAGIVSKPLSVDSKSASSKEKSTPIKSPSTGRSASSTSKSTK